MTVPANTVIVDAATVLCVRAVPAAGRQRVLRHSDFRLNASAASQFQNFSWILNNELQLLLGQSEVVNWVRSQSPASLVMMRYGGEYKFAGGSCEAGETLEQAARRELSEEFDIEVPESAILRPFNVIATKAIKGKSFRMWNFACCSDENPWLENLDINAINERLAARREAFYCKHLQGGDDAPFWSMPAEERETISPEVREVSWMDLADVVEMFLQSKSITLKPVNDFQMQEFSKYDIKERDPMYASMMTLLKLDPCRSLDGIRQVSQEFAREHSSKLLQPVSEKAEMTSDVKSKL